MAVGRIVSVSRWSGDPTVAREFPCAAVQVGGPDQIASGFRRGKFDAVTRREI